MGGQRTTNRDPAASVPAGVTDWDVEVLDPMSQEALLQRVDPGDLSTVRDWVDAATPGLRNRMVKRCGTDVPVHIDGAEDRRLEDVLARYEQEREKILAFIKERELFPVFEAQDMKILRTPGFMAPSIPAGAMMPPAPFREGTRTSLVYLTLSEELLPEHTELSIPGMMIH